jgi:sugar lactone lactonase YvrE/Tol biopolymer transport system component
VDIDHRGPHLETSVKAQRLSSVLVLSVTLTLVGAHPLLAGRAPGVAVAVSKPAPVASPATPTPGLLAYVRADSSGRNTLYFADADGSNERAILPGINRLVGWSPSGRYLLVADAAGLLMVDAEGKGIATIPSTVSGHAAWSPVADQVLVESEQPPTDIGLALYAPDGTLVRTLQPPKGVTSLYYAPRWSPDGSTILLPGCVGCDGTDDDVNQARHLWLVDANGAAPHQIGGGGNYVEDAPEWSPDGAQISFFERCLFFKPCPSNAYDGTFAMNRDGTDRHVLTDGWEAHWSPTGSQLAFMRYDYSPNEYSPVSASLFVGDAGGGHATAITGGTAFPYPVGWTRDGSRLFYVDDAGTWLVGTDGSDPVSLGQVRGVDQQFTWSTAALPEDPPSSSASVSPGGLAFDSAGNLYASDCGANRIYRVLDAHTVAVVVGSGPGGFDGGFIGDGGPATKSQIQCPFGFTFDAAGDLVLTDHGNSRIRRVSPAGTIETIAGSGHPDSGWGDIGGDGGPATQANLNNPQAVAYGPDGTLYIADRDNNRIRAVSPSGTITTLAGGSAGFSGDSGPAAEAKLNNPAGIAVAPDGTLYFADSNNNRIRKITPDGVITTIAGTGKDASQGDGGPASKASLASPEEVLLDPQGNLYEAESDSDRIRVITPDGQINAFAGTGRQGQSGDGGPAAKATLDGIGSPGDLAMDADGNLYLSSGDRIRVVDPSGIISTLQYGKP